jgi:tRNA-specific 2-thiouridylase
MLARRPLSPTVRRVSRILVALSGGVDSAVAALLLQRAGCEVATAYMKNWINEDEILGDCPWQQDITDARACAAHLGLPFEVVNLMADYRERVVTYLLDGYQRGLTPNPDVMCNREIKFGVFAQWARAHGFDAVATGHYARRTQPGDPAHPDRAGADVALLEGLDANKDQTYFLALLRPEQLAQARFPLGELTKPAVRALAAAAGLPVARKKDSQGICFIGRVRMPDFLRTYLPDRPGEIVRATDGRVLGQHRGLHYFTLGQRKGIGIPSNADDEHYVVVAKDAATNRLHVAFDRPDAPGLHCSTARVHQLSWLAPAPAGPVELEGRVRYRDRRVPLRFEPHPDGGATVHFHTPQRGLAPGQILTLHEGPRVVGGGIFGATA